MVNRPSLTAPLAKTSLLASLQQVGQRADWELRLRWPGTEKAGSISASGAAGSSSAARSSVMIELAMLPKLGETLTRVAACPA